MALDRFIPLSDRDGASRAPAAINPVVGAVDKHLRAADGVGDVRGDARRLQCWRGQLGDGEIDRAALDGQAVDASGGGERVRA